MSVALFINLNHSLINIVSIRVCHIPCNAVACLRGRFKENRNIREKSKDIERNVELLGMNQTRICVLRIISRTSVANKNIINAGNSIFSV